MLEEKEKIEYKKYYTTLFSINYLFQGFTNSMFTVIIPIYLLSLASQTGRKITASEISFIASVIMIGSAIKLLYGILSDKFAVKKLGRRRPWILFPVMTSGLFWILLPVLVSLGNIIFVFMICGLIINIGVMMADTALDGLILDICPHERLGRVQGLVWGFRSVGLISGGPILAFMVVFNIFTNIESTFYILGIAMIISAITILLIKEPLSIPKIYIIKNLKEMFKKKEDFKTYAFALLNAISEGVILLFISLFILIQLGIVKSDQMALSIAGRSSNQAFFYQSFISLLVSGGIVIGSIVMGWFVDVKSRKLGVYLGMIFLAISIFLLFLTENIAGLFIIAFIIGTGIGFRHSSYSPIAAAMSREHPEFDSTYFAFCNSLSNLGNTIGLILAAILLSVAGNFLIVFLIMAIAQLINLIPFSSIKSDYYEV
ncbi:MAG: MFS transporter [Candidatus Lokiarchaeota archaeon]|nr:MFS transporter [Candidatus Lokiarchaeota archaeon]MBD3339926.1 MFS transporter [Candidatus Lokiarchaeota archaeon]